MGAPGLVLFEVYLFGGAPCVSWGRTQELESVGIRLNKRPPNISFKIKKTGGVRFNSMVRLSCALAACALRSTLCPCGQVDCTHMNEKLCKTICQEYSECLHDLVKSDCGGMIVADCVCCRDPQRRRAVP